jgi:tetratricopeptide (TPR) repeat protein
MNRFVRRAAMAALFVSAAAAAADAAVPARNGPAARRGAQAAQSAGQARREIGTKLNDAQKLTDMKDFAGALAKVKEADALDKKNPYEEFMVAKYLGFIAVNQPMPDYAAAAAAYNRQVASGGIPDMEKPAVYNIAMRLNYQEMNFPEAIKDAAELQKLQPLDDIGYTVLVQSYNSVMDFNDAAMTAKAWVASKTAAGMQPTEDSLKLLLNAQVKLMDEAGSKETLDQLASISSSPDVWGQIIDITLSTKGMTDHQLLNLYRLSMLTGTMKDQDYVAMASIDLQNQLPSEAKAVLTKGSKSGELMTQANQFLARDQQTLTALAAEAAKQKNGEVDVKLGESYLTYGRYDEAIASMQKGIAKGGLKDPADAQTTLGIALFNAGKKPEAAQAFEQASVANPNSSAGRVAHAWALYMKRQSTA